MEGQRLLSSHDYSSVRLLELFQMPPRSIRSDERNVCRSSPEVADIWLVKKEPLIAEKCHLLAVFWVSKLVRKSGILNLEHLKVTH